MPPVVEVEALEKTYRPWPRRGPGQRALAGVSLRIPAGIAFGLIGPNGAGKTTFIKLLLGIARPDRGTVRVLGGDPEDLAVRAQVGYLPERLHLPAALSALDVLRSVAVLKRLQPTEAELRALLERVGLAASSQRVGTFSKGMRQRLGLAMALLGAPRLLVLDEPTDGIDPPGRAEVRALLLAERARGATVLLNSHLLSETERVCDRVGILDQGRLTLEGSLDEVRRASGRWYLRFAPGADPAALARAGFTPEGPGWAFAGADEGPLNLALDQARAAGARLLELAPASRDLEAVLAAALEAGRR